MCLVLMCAHAHPKFPFIVLSNRDEYYLRSKDDGGLTIDESGVICSLVQCQDELGTWMGLNSSSGTFVTVTNIDGHFLEGSRELSRGILVREMLKDPEGVAAQKLLSQPKKFPGYNLLWCNIKHLGSLPWHYSNCDLSEVRPKQVVAQNHQGCCSTLVAMGNDILGDEHVKCNFVQKEVASLLESQELKDFNGTAEEMRDRLITVFNTNMPKTSFLALLGKFLRFGTRRRVQPGLWFGLAALLPTAAAALAALLVRRCRWPGGGGGGGPSLLPPPPPWLLLGLGLAGGGLALGAGWWAHCLEQHIFREPAGRLGPFSISLPRFFDRTVSQTAILLDSEGKLYYNFRKTTEGSQNMGEWETIEKKLEPSS